LGGRKPGADEHPAEAGGRTLGDLALPARGGLADRRARELERDLGREPIGGLKVARDRVVAETGPERGRERGADIGFVVLPHALTVVGPRVPVIRGWSGPDPEL